MEALACQAIFSSAEQEAVTVHSDISLHHVRWQPDQACQTTEPVDQARKPGGLHQRGGGL